MDVLGSYQVPPCGPNTSHLPPEVGNLCALLCDLHPSKRPKSNEALDSIRQIVNYDRQDKN